ncbi:MAG: F420-dependent oxidoreductase [Acidimicrobiia bacterium]|nr:F420-dependent oxidoreductase [Acidimicrobiia bacterium]
MYLILSETWTMTDPRDLRRLVDYAVVAEQAGFHGVMVGEHVVHGPNSAFRGVPKNPRMWLRDGNQDPRYPHPSGLHLLTAMAAVTTTLRLMAAAMLTPLRHPLIVAKELATVDLISQGRLIVLPGVSWQREEYAAIGVPFEQRGRILDEQLEIWEALWQKGSPVSYHGEHFDFTDMYVEPEPYRPGGPEMWIGGRAFSPWTLRRAVRYGQGFFPVIHPSADDLAALRSELKAAGRDPETFEMGALLFGPPFKGTDDLLDIDEALAPMEAMITQGFTTFVLKPSQYINDGALLGDFCRDVMSKVGRLAS